MFRKISEEEMIIADQLKDTLRKTRETLANNFDQKDAEFVSLYDELKRLFDKKNLDEITQEDMKRNIAALQQIFDKITELNRRNNLLKAKYENDAKYARTHKRIMERGNISKSESEIHETLMNIKNQIDEKVLINTKLLNNEPFFHGVVTKDVIQSFGKTNVKLDVESAKYINNILVKEYISEFQGTDKW
jgi:type I restriction enzyme, R subunit